MTSWTRPHHAISYNPRSRTPFLFRTNLRIRRCSRVVDYLIFGAQKAGTSVFNGHLRQHNEIRVARISEAHFYDDLISTAKCNDFTMRKGEVRLPDALVGKSKGCNGLHAPHPSRTHSDFHKLPRRKVLSRDRQDVRGKCGDDLVRGQAYPGRVGLPAGPGARAPVSRCGRGRRLPPGCQPAVGTGTEWTEGNAHDSGVR